LPAADWRGDDGALELIGGFCRGGVHATA
jgi:hypothetical protein